MHVKQAVGIAKKYLSDLFADEGIENLGLEEVRFDESSNSWSITIGFSRPWDRAGQEIQNKGLVATLNGPTPRARSYKVLRINGASGEVESLTDRFLKAS